MRCVLIASAAAELLFYWADAAFARRLRPPPGPGAAQAPALEDGLNTLFAPLIISCTALLEKLSDTYTCFTSEPGGHLHVLHMFGDCLYIAVNGDGAEGEDELRRKLFVLRRLVDAHCGLAALDAHLVRRELRPADSEQRERVWGLLRGLLDTYSRLREEEQSFAVEAVERLLHPQLCEQCIELLERHVVQRINGSAERGADEVAHAFLLVHSKLLAFYSSRSASAVRPADLLVLILLVQDLYPSGSAEDELGPQPAAETTFLQVPQRSESIPVSSTGSRAAAGRDSDDQDTDDLSTPEVFYTPEPSPRRHSTGSESGSEGPEAPGAGDADGADVQMAEDLLQTLGPQVPEASNPRRVFLDANLPEGYCAMLPHTMHCLPLWPGISLVLLSKGPMTHVAVTLHQLLDGFLVLEKKLGEGQEVGAARALPFLAELRQRMDKFVRKLGGQDLQVGAGRREAPGGAGAAAGGRAGAELCPCLVAERLGGAQGQDAVAERAGEPAGGAAGAGHREAAALRPVPPALPDLRQPEPVPGPAGPCPEPHEGEAAGLEGLSAGEEQAQHHHGVIPGGLSRPRALHLRRPHGWADDGPVAQRGGEVQLRAGQGSPRAVRQGQGVVPDRAGAALPAEGLHDARAAGRRLLLLLLPVVRERAGLQAGRGRGAGSGRRLCAHRDVGGRLLQAAAALLQQEPPVGGGEVLRAAHAAPGHHPLRARAPAGLRPGPAPLGALPHPAALSAALCSRCSLAGIGAAHPARPARTPRGRGRGHNGLVAAAYLQQGGLRTAVLERRHVLGGAAVTEEIVPGFKFSRASYLLSLLRPQIYTELELQRHGLRVLPRDPYSFTPLLGAGSRPRSLLLGHDVQRSQQQIAQFSARDAQVPPGTAGQPAPRVAGYWGWGERWSLRSLRLFPVLPLLPRAQPLPALALPCVLAGVSRVRGLHGRPSGCPGPAAGRCPRGPGRAGRGLRAAAAQGAASAAAAAAGRAGHGAAAAPLLRGAHGARRQGPGPVVRVGAAEGDAGHGRGDRRHGQPADAGQRLRAAAPRDGRAAGPARRLGLRGRWHGRPVWSHRPRGGRPRRARLHREAREPRAAGLGRAGAGGGPAGRHGGDEQSGAVQRVPAAHLPGARPPGAAARGLCPAHPAG